MLLLSCGMDWIATQNGVEHKQFLGDTEDEILGSEFAIDFNWPRTSPSMHMHGGRDACRVEVGHRKAFSGLGRMHQP